MGLSIDYFYSLTPREFYNIQQGKIKLATQEFEANYYLTKTLAYFIYLSTPEGKKRKKKSFDKFLEIFENKEDEDEKPQYDHRDVKQIFEQIDKDRG